MPDQSAKSSPGAVKYEIAKPQSYSAYPLDAAQKRTASIDTAEAPRGVQESWSDAEGSADDISAGGLSSLVRADQSGLQTSTPVETRAVWVVHGMGQQIPFETLDQLARGILQDLAGRNQFPVPRLRTVEIAGQVLQRVEIDVCGSEKDNQGRTKNYDLHLYETYWAPDTEGVAKLSDVMSFLWDGGTRGILNCLKPFLRAMFGGMTSFKIPKRSAFYLCVTLLTLIALTVINGVIVASAAAKAKLVQVPSLTTHWHELAAIASIMVAVGFTLGMVLFLANLCKPETLSTTWKLTISILGWISVGITIVQILFTAVLMTTILHLDWLCSHSLDHQKDLQVAGCTAPSFLVGVFSWVNHFFAGLPVVQLQAFATCIIICGALLLGIAMTVSAMLRSSEKSLRGDSILLVLTFLAFAANVLAIAGPIYLCARDSRCDALPSFLCFLGSSFWVFPFLSVFSAKVRELMVQYVGDVAIYVQPNKLDRFNKVRNEIKEAARSVVSAIFTAYAGGSATKFLYDQVALVGHSLGSVIAYDTLNRLMQDDWLSGRGLRVPERTKTMVTFGSPLNKTAFFFTIQAKDSLHIRERLASTVQPLIMSYRKFRSLNWINVYSSNDIISGSLRFYDLPGKPSPPAVNNILDPDACVPLIAHVSYWTNPTVWRELLKQIAP
jgi:hypothetical protein